MSLGDGADRVDDVRRGGAVGDLLEDTVLEGYVAGAFGTEESRTPRVGDQLVAYGAGVVAECGVPLRGPGNVAVRLGRRQPVRDLGDHSAGNRGVEDDAGVPEQVALAAVLAVGGIGLLPGRDRVLVVAGERGEGGVGDAFLEERRGGAEQPVADLDVMVEEGQRLARCHGREPEADLGEIGCHRVDVDAVEAAGDVVVERFAEVGGGEVKFAGASGGQSQRDAPGGCD